MSIRNKLSDFTPWEYVVDNHDFITIDSIITKKHQKKTSNVQHPQHQKTQMFFPQVEKKKSITHQIVIHPAERKKEKNIYLVQKKIDVQRQKTQHKKESVSVKPIPKSNIIIRISEDLVHKPPKINLQKIGMKHVIKNISSQPMANSLSSLKILQKDIRQQFKRLVPLRLKRRGSQDILFVKKDTSQDKNIKNTVEDTQVIKKCALRNIHIYQEQRQTKQEIKIKVNKVNSQQHILDRLLTRLD